MYLILPRTARPWSSDPSARGGLVLGHGKREGVALDVEVLADEVDAAACGNVAEEEERIRLPSGP